MLLVVKPASNFIQRERSW